MGWRWQRQQICFESEGSLHRLVEIGVAIRPLDRPVVSLVGRRLRANGFGHEDCTGLVRPRHLSVVVVVATILIDGVKLAEHLRVIGRVVVLGRHVERVGVLRGQVFESTAEFGSLDAELALADLFFKHDGGILSGAQLLHGGGHHALVVHVEVILRRRL